MIFILILKRKELYGRIDLRVDAMMEAGFLDEVRGLLSRGFEPGLPALTGIGYRELILHLQGKMPLGEAVTVTKQKTHQFARRQMTWFRKIKNAVFVDVNEESAATEDPLDAWFYSLPPLAENVGKSLGAYVNAQGPVRLARSVNQNKLTAQLAALTDDFFSF